MAQWEAGCITFSFSHFSGQHDNRRREIQFWSIWLLHTVEKEISPQTWTR